MNLFNDNRLNTYLHTTHEEQAKSIFNFGFFVNDSLMNTTDDVSKDTFGFWSRYRKGYGKYCVVIQIPRNLLYNEGHKALVSNDEAWKTYLKVEELIDDEFEYEFLIPTKFIRGYFINLKDFVENPAYNPYK